MPIILQPVHQMRSTVIAKPPNISSYAVSVLDSSPSSVAQTITTATLVTLPSTGSISFFQFTANSNMTLSQLGYYIYSISGATGSGMIAIFNDNSNAPGNLLAYSASTSAVLGWNDLPLNVNVNIV